MSGLDAAHHPAAGLPFAPLAHCYITTEEEIPTSLLKGAYPSVSKVIQTKIHATLIPT